MKAIIQLTALTTLALLLACKPNYQSELSYERNQSSKPVKIVQVSEQTDPLPLTASGIISSKAQAALSFKISGIVESIYTEEGQSVKKGQTLASLDLDEINAQVIKAEQALGKAKRDLQRVENLLADSAATLEQYQNSQTAYEVAESDLKIANFNRRYAEIKAPANGKILKRFVEEGELIEPGSPIFLIGETGKDAYVVRMGVADRDVIRIVTGDKAEYTLAAYPGRTFSARVTEIAEAADAQTGTFEIEMTLDETNAVIKTGFVAKLVLYPSNVEPYFDIPMDALVEADRDQAKIFILDKDSTALLTEVQPIEIKSTSFIIPASQLEAGSNVVTVGSAYLREGDQVSILPN